MVTLNSNTDPNHAGHVSPSPDAATKVRCKPLPKRHCPSPWCVPPHFSTGSHQGTCCNTHLQSSSAFGMVQTRPRPDRALCPGSRPPHSKELPCQPQSCPPPPSPLDLYPQTRNPPRKAGNTGPSLNLLDHPRATAHANRRLCLAWPPCITMASYCLVNQIHSTDQLCPSTGCATEGVRL